MAYSLASQIFAQGTFQNLGFEAAQNIAAFDPYGPVLAADALPNWVCYAGTNQTSLAAYNSLALSSAWIGLHGSNSPFVPQGLRDGEYCVSLQYGVTTTDPPFQYGPASVAQTGQAPVDALSIRFRGTSLFTVTFEGELIPLVVLSTRSTYNIYGGDISGFAGQTGELRITYFAGSSFNAAFIDVIRFSNLPIPEPSTACLIGVGFGIFCYHLRRLGRAKDA